MNIISKGTNGNYRIQSVPKMIVFLIVRKHLTNSIKDIVQNNWTVILESVEVMKATERLETVPGRRRLKKCDS